VLFKIAELASFGYTASPEETLHVSFLEEGEVEKAKR
jgi:hypothetical protein